MAVTKQRKLSVSLSLVFLFLFTLLFAPQSRCATTGLQNTGSEDQTNKDTSKAASPGNQKHVPRFDELKTPYTNPRIYEFADEGDQQTAPGSDLPLSSSAHVLAEELGLIEDLKRLKSMRDSGSTDAQEYSKLKQSIVETLLLEMLEVRSTISRIDIEIAEADDLHAYLEEKRDRAIRLNTMANFVSGGVSGIIGGALGYHPPNQYSITSVDLGEGVVQSSIAALAFKQQHGERRISRGVPNMLSKVFGLEPAPEFPPSVWRFLNDVPATAKSKRTRRQMLIDHWAELETLNRTRIKSDNKQEKIAHLTGTHPYHRHVTTINILAVRSAMLHDLRAVVSQIDTFLLEIMRFVRASKPSS